MVQRNNLKNYKKLPKKELNNIKYLLCPGKNKKGEYISVAKLMEKYGLSQKNCILNSKYVLLPRDTKTQINLEYYAKPDAIFHMNVG